MSGRKQRIDSATAAVNVMASALVELEPPEHCPLPDGALPFWRAITRGRAREEWLATPALLATASNLAWTQFQVLQLRKQIDAGEAIDAKTLSRMTEMQRLEMAYLRTLQQHGRGAEGEARDVGKRRSAATGITAENPLDDTLLARPTVQ